MEVVLCVCCVCVVLCVCVVFVLCLCCEKGVERVGVGGRGKYPGAPPHHLKKELADRKDQVVKGEGCSEKKSHRQSEIVLEYMTMFRTDSN
jgi:hypothetical protein